jgi:methionine synthase II (cobalamin-independent)
MNELADTACRSERQFGQALAVTGGFDRYGRGEADEKELVQAQDAAIREVIRKQEEIGLPVVSDGEFRRRNFQESFGHAVPGYDVPACRRAAAAQAQYCARRIWRYRQR